MFTKLSPSSILRIDSFEDIDALRDEEGFMDYESIPLRSDGFPIRRPILFLPGLTVRLLQSFPQILNVYNPTDYPVIWLPAMPSPGVSINGNPLDMDAFCFIGSSTGFKAIDRAATCVYSIRLITQIDRRGWPDLRTGFHMWHGKPAQMAMLRDVLKSIFFAASQSGLESEPALPLESMQDSILLALDQLLATQDNITPIVPSSFHLRIVAQVDDLLMADTSKVYYSENLAEQLDVSVRSLHAAMVAVRGLSLHRYLRLRRLWSVRTQLLSAKRSEKVKSIALANGFWHLGDFASMYFKTFRERPSETLARFV